VRSLISPARSCPPKSEDPGELVALEPPRGADRPRRPHPRYGDFVHYHLLARGSLDVVIESDVTFSTSPPSP